MIHQIALIAIKGAPSAGIVTFSKAEKMTNTMARTVGRRDIRASMSGRVGSRLNI